MSALFYYNRPIGWIHKRTAPRDDMCIGTVPINGHTEYADDAERKILKEIKKRRKQLEDAERRLAILRECSS